MLITLKAKTVKGTTKLNNTHEDVIKKKPNWKDIWMVGQAHDVVSFSQVAGPWLFIYPQGADSRDFDKHSRWVNLKADIDFEVTVMQP